MAVLLLLCQLGMAMSASINWIVNTEIELCEFMAKEDCSSEEENQEEHDEKQRHFRDLAVLSSSVQEMQYYHSMEKLAVHHPEVSTPPPEQLI